VAKRHPNCFIEGFGVEKKKPPWGVRGARPYGGSDGLTYIY